MEWFGRNPVGSIKTAVSPLCGNHDYWRARTGLRPSRFSPRLRQATDLAVAQAVVDEDEKFAGRGHAADLSAPAFAHVAVVASDGRVGALSDYALDGGPAHEAGPLLGDVAPVHRDVGLFVDRGQPGPAAEMAGALEPCDVPDLGHEYRSQHRADAGNGLHSVVAEVTSEVRGGLLFEHGDLTINVLDQVPQGFDTHPIGIAQMHLVEQALSTDSEEVGHGHGHPLFGEHGMDLGLEVRPEVDELGPITDVLTELTQGWWSDPGFSQASQAQQVNEIGGVALVVLHPPVAPVVAERMGQVHVAPALLDHIGRPVPAIGRFEDHLGMLTGLGQLGRQDNRIVVDPDRVERLSCLVAPHDHAAAPVQIDADILCLLFHGSLLLSFAGRFRNPKCALHTWSRATGGLPRALRLCSVGLRHAPRCHEIAPRAGRSSRCATGARHAGAALRSFITSNRKVRRVSVQVVHPQVSVITRFS